MKKCNALQAVIYGIRPISAGQNVQYEPCEGEGVYKCSKCGKFFCYMHIVSVETSEELQSVEITKGVWVFARPTAYFCKDCSPDERHRDPNAETILVKKSKRK